MRVNREHLLQTLETVNVSVSRVPSFQQAGCLVFDNNQVVAFNGDMACRRESPLEGIQGAVPANTLMEYLRRLQEEELDVEVKDDCLIIKGKGRRMKFAMEKDVVLPVESIEAPEKWLALSQEFCEAAGMVADCAGKDQKKFSNTCVNVTPQWLEAYDGSQMMRYRLETGIEERFLIPKVALKQVCIMGMTEFALTERWAHFKCDNFILSSLRFPELEFYDLSPALAKGGEAVTLPKGLADAADLAELASKEGGDDNLLLITLAPGEVRIIGQGITAEYEERRKVHYQGPEMSFRISPATLKILAEKYDKASVTQGRLLVDGGKWRYAVLLSLPE